MNKKTVNEIIKQLTAPKRVKTEAGEVENRDAADVADAVKLIKKLEDNATGGGFGVILERRYK